MSQSKKASVVETLTNFFAGIILSLVSYWYLLPLYGIHIPLIANVSLTAYFAVMSIVKTYLIRRGFNRADVRHEMRNVRPHMGSIQSLRRSSPVPHMSKREYEDLINGIPVPTSEGPVRPSTQGDADTGRKEDKELRK